MILLFFLLLSFSTSNTILYVSATASENADCSYAKPCTFSKAMDLKKFFNGTVQLNFFGGEYNVPSKTYTLGNEEFILHSVSDEIVLITDESSSNSVNDVGYLVLFVADNNKILRKFSVFGITFRNFNRPLFESRYSVDVNFTSMSVQNSKIPSFFINIDYGTSSSIVIHDSYISNVQCSSEFMFNFTQTYSIDQLITMDLQNSFFSRVSVEEVFHIWILHGSLIINVYNTTLEYLTGNGLYTYTSDYISADISSSVIRYNLHKVLHFKCEQLFTLKMNNNLVMDQNGAFTVVLMHSYSGKMRAIFNENIIKGNTCQECDAPLSFYGADEISFEKNHFLNNSCTARCRGGGSFKIEECGLSGSTNIRINGDYHSGNSIKYNFGANLFLTECINLNLTIRNSKFFDNNAGSGSLTPNGFGGAIAITSIKNIVIDIQNSEFKRNSATRGGAIFIDNPYNTSRVDIKLYSSTFDGNNALQYSVGSYEEGGLFDFYKYISDTGSASMNIDIFDCEFSNHESKFGGIFADSSSSVTQFNVRNSRFFNNRALYYGGCFSLIFADMYIDNCTFSGNTAFSKQYVGYRGRGGAIFLETGNLTLRDTKFDGNMAEDDGGSIYLKEVENVNIFSSEFRNDNAGNLGGSIAFEGVKNFHFSKDSTVTQSNATFGGGLFFSSLNNDEQHDILGTITSNTASGGGGIFFGTNNVLNEEEMESVVYNVATSGNDYLSIPTDMRMKTKPMSSYCVAASKIKYQCVIRSLEFVDKYNNVYKIPSYTPIFLTLRLDYLDDPIEFSTLETTDFSFSFEIEEVIEFDGDYKTRVKFGNTTETIVIRFSMQKETSYWWLVGVIFGCLGICCFVFIILLFYPYISQKVGDMYYRRKKKNANYVQI